MVFDSTIPTAGPTPKSPPVSAPFRENWAGLQRALYGVNWCANGVGPSIWPAGDAAAPAYHRLTGAGAAIARAGVGLTSTLKKWGEFCSKVTPGGGAAGVFEHRLVRATSFSRFGWLKGRYVWAAAWVYTTGVDAVRLRIFDGVASADSPYHSGSSVSSPAGPDADGWELLQVVKVIDAAATELALRVEGVAGAPAYWVDGLGGGWGDVPHDYPHACPHLIATLNPAYPGTLTTTANPVAGVRYPFQRPAIVLEAGGVVGTAPTGAAIILDVNKNGSTMFTTKPTIAIAGTSGFAVPDGTYAARCFARRDQLSVDLDQIGSTVIGANLTAQATVLQYMRPHERLLAIDEVD